MDDQNLEAQDYQNFDDFAQRGSQAEQRQLFSQSFSLQQSELATADSLKHELLLTLTKPKK